MALLRHFATQMLPEKEYITLQQKQVWNMVVRPGCLGGGTLEDWKQHMRFL